MPGAPPRQTPECDPDARPGSDEDATEIFRWSTRIAKCAISALSMFRTVCFGVYSAVVRTGTPRPLRRSENVMILADFTPGKVVSSSSARRIGRTLPAIGVPPDSDE